MKEVIDWGALEELERQQAAKKVVGSRIKCIGDPNLGVKGCGREFGKFTPTLVQNSCPRCQAIQFLGMSEEAWIRGVRKFQDRELKYERH